MGVRYQTASHYDVIAKSKMAAAAILNFGYDVISREGVDGSSSYVVGTLVWFGILDTPPQYSIIDTANRLIISAFRTILVKENFRHS